MILRLRFLVYFSTFVTFNILANQASTSEQFWQEFGQSELVEVQQTIIRNWAAKNIILFIGDGFGISEFVAARIFQGQQKSQQPSGEFNRLFMEQKLPFVALSKTFSTSHQVPDSSATAFAMVSGVKTVSGTVGFSGDDVIQGVCDPEKKGVPTIAHHFKQVNKRVGVVTTARVTHATPSSVYAKTADRDWEASAAGTCPDIASQILLERNLLDVIFGGGAQNFVPKGSKTPFGGNSKRKDGTNLFDEWEKQGGRFVHNVDSMDALKDLKSPVLGVFSDTHLNYEASGSKPASEPTLQNMTLKALDLLVSQNSPGFFLMVEGARIDHAQHRDNPYLMLTEATAFDETIKLVMERINLDETLVIATADHSHAFSIMGYPPLNNPILGFSEDTYSEKTPKEKFPTLVYGAGPGVKAGIPPENANKDFQGYNYPAATNNSQGKHGGEDVIILANGPMAHLFSGIRMQSYIGHVMQYASRTGFYKDKAFPQYLSVIDFSPTLGMNRIISVFVPLLVIATQLFNFL